MNIMQPVKMKCLSLNDSKIIKIKFTLGPVNNLIDSCTAYTV